MNRSIVSLILIPGLFIAGCREKSAESKSMDALYAENGIPVTVETVEPGEFSPECTFHADLSGIEETVVSAMVSDTVEKILFAVGDHVNKDDTVIHFPTDNPSTPYFQTKTAFEHAGATLRRIKNLYDNGGISLQEYENTRAQFEATKANWESVQRAVRVKAPISGMVTRKNIRKSDSVRPGDPLFTIADTRTLRARVWVTEEQISRVVKGAPAIATWRDITLQGKVVETDLSLDPNRKAFGAVIEFPNPGRYVHAGVNAEIRVSGSGDRALVIDRKDVVTEGDSAYVYLAMGNSAVKRPVTLGRRQDVDVEIIRGLEPGDRIITGGQMLLEDGTKIRIVE